MALGVIKIDIEPMAYLECHADSCANNRRNEACCNLKNVRLSKDGQCMDYEPADTCEAISTSGGYGMPMQCIRKAGHVGAHFGPNGRTWA